MTPEEIKTLGHAFFDGKTLQYQYDNRDWMDWTCLYCPGFKEGFNWRIKPDEPKKVKYLCYQELTGEFLWFREGTRKGFKRIPELDLEITLPEGEQ